ncbi:MAG: DUF3943 domain-containing protein [Myxococcaceae bacterium]
MGRRASGRSGATAVLALLPLLLIPSAAEALDVQTAFVSLDGDWEPWFSDKLCATVTETLGLSRDLDSPARCAQVRTPEGAHELAAARGSGDYALNVNLRQLPDGELELLLEPWPERAPPAVARLCWTIRKAPAAQKLEQLRQRLRASLGQLGEERGVRELVLLRTLSGSSRLSLDGRARYQDVRTGAQLDFHQASTLFRLESEGSPDVLGALLELGGVLAIGEVWYLTDTAVSRNDWKYDVSWSTLEKKLLTGQALQFDDNVLYLNSPGHPVGGAVYYVSARHHGFEMLGALVASAATATAWEYLTEFREIAAINDFVMTPLGGLAFGEPLYQLSDFFRRSRPTVLNLLLSGLFSLPSSLNPVRDRSAPGGLRLLDSRGLSADRWHRFHLAAGFDLDHADGRLASALGGSLRFDAHILGQPSFGRPGILNELMAGALSTRMHLAASFGSRGLQDLTLFGETVYAGFWTQDLEGTDDRVRGATGLAGLSSIFEHEERFLPGLSDQVAMVAPAGLALRGTYERGDLRLTVGGDAHPVFGAMFSQAYPVLTSSALAVTGESPVLRAHGYYWSWGVRGAASLEFEYREAAFGVELRRYSVFSTERDLPRKTGSTLYLADRRQVTRLWLAHALPAPDLWVRATFERAKRWSEALDLATAQDDSRVHLQLVWRW